MTFKQQTLWKNAFLPRCHRKADKGECLGTAAVMLLVWMYMICVRLHDRYMHQIFMPLCLMNTVYKQVLVQFLLNAQHTSNCRPDPTHEYKTDGPISFHVRTDIQGQNPPPPPPSLFGCCYSLLYCFQWLHLLKTINVKVHHTIMMSYKMDFSSYLAQKIWF